MEDAMLVLFLLSLMGIHQGAQGECVGLKLDYLFVNQYHGYLLLFLIFIEVYQLVEREFCSFRLPQINLLPHQTNHIVRFVRSNMLILRVVQAQTLFNGS